MMSKNINFDQIKNYFDQKLTDHGATPRGADWNSDASQALRFEQLVKICRSDQPFSIIDYGCGYGALVDFLTVKGYSYHYTGFDLLEPMVRKAREVYSTFPHCTFTAQEADLKAADCCIASGIFNIKFQYSDETWTEYVIQVLNKMDSLSKNGFSFNMLTVYSDTDHMRPDLYYADPCFLFDYCKRHFAKNVALLHDYGLYDFTILVRKQIA